MADPYVRQSAGVFEGTVGSTDLVAGTPVYFDGTDWEKANATNMTKYAEAIVINSVRSGEQGKFCRRCVIVDIDSAAYTQGDQYFLSATAGAITRTRPTGDSNLKQVLGFGLSANELEINIPPVREKMLWVDLPYPEGNAAVTVDADWAGKSFLTDGDAAHGTQQFPENTVGLEIAYLWLYNEDDLLTGNVTVDVSAGVSDESGTLATDSIASTAVPVTTADDLVRVDVTEAFDGSGIVEPGNHFGVDIAKASETGDDDFRAHGVAVIVLVV